MAQKAAAAPYIIGFDGDRSRQDQSHPVRSVAGMKNEISLRKLSLPGLQAFQTEPSFLLCHAFEKNAAFQAHVFHKYSPETF